MNYNFQHIAGYQTEKEELKRICDIINNRNEYLQKGAKLPKGIILYGETGTGKTLFSKVMANVCNLNVLQINIADSSDDNDVCNIIRRTFIKANRRKTPSMIFFDELDKVLPNEEERYVTDRSKTVLAQLLTLIDGMDSTGKIIFVATCNDYSVLPETLVRPGRIDKKISIGLPTYASRVEILKMYAKKSSCRFEMPLEEMAKLLGGFSCAALETFINECILQSDKNGFVSEELIRKQMLEIKNEDIPRERSSVEDSINACRSLGCFVVARAFNSGHYTLTLDKESVCNNFFENVITLNKDDDDWDDDDDDWDDDDDIQPDDVLEANGEEIKEQMPNVLSKSDYLNTISVLYGGYVAEELIYNKVYDNVSDSLSAVDALFEKMLNTAMFGIEYRYDHQRHDYFLPYSANHLEKINALYEETIKNCYEKAKEIVSKNVDLIKKLSSVLVEKLIVTETETEKLVEEFGGIKA